MKIIIDLDDKESYFIPYWVNNVTVNIDDLVDEVDEKTHFKISHVNEQRIDTFIPHIRYLVPEIELYIYDNCLDLINENLENYRNI